MQFASRAAPGLQIFPKHFVLHPAEQIHFTACFADSRPRCPDAEFTITDTQIVRMVDPKGILEALRPGRTQLVARTATAETRIEIEVAGTRQPEMRARPHSEIREIVAKDLLIVGHANLDGYDHTAVAKPGIDLLVREARKKGWTVAYFVSKEYPNWYTADRQPDYAIISEGQEHQIRIVAERIIFTGGSFAACTLRNAQMTLHSMIQHNVARRIHFVFPAQAIWRGPVDGQPYPAPMALLSAWFASRANDAQAYDQVAIPFLDRMIQEYPILNYPSNPPAPPLRDLIQGWSIVVRFGERFERVYRRGNSDKTLLIEFEGV